MGCVIWQSLEDNSRHLLALGKTFQRSGPQLSIHIDLPRSVGTSQRKWHRFHAVREMSPSLSEDNTLRSEEQHGSGAVLLQQELQDLFHPGELLPETGL